MEGAFLGCFSELMFMVYVSTEHELIKGTQWHCTVKELKALVVEQRENPPKTEPNPGCPMDASQSAGSVSDPRASVLKQPHFSCLELFCRHFCVLQAY